MTSIMEHKGICVTVTAHYINVGGQENSMSAVRYKYSVDESYITLVVCVTGINCSCNCKYNATSPLTIFKKRYII